MRWVVSGLQFIADKLHIPISGFGTLRLFLVLLGSLLTLAMLEWRFKALTRFLNEKSTALNLAVARVAVAATLLGDIRLHDILLSTSLDPALRVPFGIWGRLASRLIAPPALTTAIYAIFLLSTFLMLVGLFGRVASAATAISAVYLISFLFLYGKVDHAYHHLVFFSVLCALFPSTDTLSLDAVLAAWREADAGRLRRNQPGLAYGYAMQSMWVFVGLAYYFPGLWKISRGWLQWLSGTALQDYIALAGELVPWTPLQLWIVRHPLLMSLGSGLVVIFELGFIFVILFPRLRPFAGLLGLAFHTATYLVLKITFLSLQTCYVIFFDWTAIFSWISRKLSLGGATVLYDPHCKLCRRTVGTLAIFDWTSSLTFVPNSQAFTLPARMQDRVPDEPELYFSVIADNGRAGSGYEGYKLIAERLPLLWLLRPLMGLPGIQQLGTAIYERVAASRICTVLDKTQANGESLLSAEAQPIALAVPLAGLGLMAALGLIHLVNSWPLSCFPTFDGPTFDIVTQLSVQTMNGGNVAEDWNLTCDPKLRAVYRRWYWLTRQGTTPRIATRPKVAALVNLWLAYHPELHVTDVVVSLDWYQMRPLEGSRVRVARQKNWEFAF
jgi:predicted DCC family thiol-disulfide oxidoreductase YuxK